MQSQVRTPHPSPLNPYSPLQPRLPTRSQARPILGQALQPRPNPLPPRRLPPQQAKRRLRPRPGTPSPPPLQHHPSLLRPHPARRPSRSNAPRRPNRPPTKPNLEPPTPTQTPTPTTTPLPLNKTQPPPAPGPTPTTTTPRRPLPTPAPTRPGTGPRPRRAQPRIRRRAALLRRSHGRGDDGPRVPCRRGAACV
jgi:hypothetical protein